MRKEKKDNIAIDRIKPAYIEEQPHTIPPQTHIHTENEEAEKLNTDITPTTKTDRKVHWPKRIYKEYITY